MSGPPAPLPTLPEDWGRGLAIAAHPDDLEYGSASAIARWTDQGKSFAYVLATSGEAGIDGMSPDEAGPVREAEERASAAVVGVEEVEFLGLADGTLQGGPDLRRLLARAIRRHRPEVIVSLNLRLTFGGRSFNMADHRVLGEAVLDAARDAGNRWIFGELVDEGHEPWGGTRLVALAGSPEPSHHGDVTGHLDRGIASLAKHRAYLEGLAAGGDEAPDPDAMLREWATEAGRANGVDHAVTLEVYEL